MDPQDESLSAAIAHGQALLLAAGIEQPRHESRRLLAHVLGVSATGLLGHRRIGDAERRRFEALVRRRAAREPLAYIVGHQGFWTLELEVTPDTLIPRADSEAVIECLLRLRPDRDRVRRILDLGTGTGCLLLAALHEYPGAAGVGIDVAEAACRLAARNAQRNRLADRTMLACGRWHAALAPAPGAGFDVVLSNPPYIPTGEIPGLMAEVAGHEPRPALDGGPDGTACYRSILSGLDGMLAPDAILLFEIGQGQADAVTALAGAAGFRLLEAGRDLGGIVRALAFTQA